MAVTSSALAAEFTGTFLLIFTVGCNVLSKNAVWGGISIACVLMVSIFSFGGISGANFNPAVSFALGLNGSMEWKDVGIYSTVQLVSGILAGFSYFLLFGKAFNVAPVPGFGLWSAGACEALYTCMLCFVVLNVAAVKKGCQEWFGLAIGFVIIAGAYGAGAVSGGCFNPAVAFGIDVSSLHLGFGWSLVYAVFELVGAALAVALFKVVRPKGGEEDEEYPLSAKMLSELLGTYMLVLTVGLNVLGSSASAAFSIAAALTSMIYALGDVSGANFNPAVTAALVARKDLDYTTGLAYVCAQIVGGISAAITYRCILNKTFPLGPGKGFLPGQAFMAEVLFTFVLVLVVLCAAVSPKTASANFFGLAIGSCVTVGGFAIGAISGGSLNPAVSIGIGAVGKSLGTALHYSGAELIGAMLATGLVMVTHEEEASEKGEKEPIA